MKFVSLTDYLAFNQASSQELIKVFEPLFKQFAITFFAHARTFLDGSLSILTTDAYVTEFWFKQNFALGVFTEPGYYIGSALGEIFPAQHREALREAHKLDHLFYIIEKHSKHSDIFLLATTPDNELIIQHYLSSLDRIKHFLLYYQDKAKDLLQSANNKRLITQKPAQDIAIPTNLLQTKQLPFHTSGKQRYYLYSLEGEICYLTKKEWACIYHLVQGYSAEQVSGVLNISRRTVEMHIENMKKRLACKNLPQLIYLIMKSPLASLLN